MQRLFKLIGAVCLIGLASISAASANPLHALTDAILAAKQEANKANAFAGYSGLCIGAIAVSNAGPAALNSLRTCTYRPYSKADIHQVMAANNWPLSFAGNNVEYFRNANLSVAAWYMVVYNKAGQASEVVVVVDTTTD